MWRDLSMVANVRRDAGIPPVRLLLAGDEQHRPRDTDPQAEQLATALRADGVRADILDLIAWKAHSHVMDTAAIQGWIARLQDPAEPGAAPPLGTRLVVPPPPAR